jgi:arylsulfatase A-like enzyme
LWAARAPGRLLRAFFFGEMSAGLDSCPDADILGIVFLCFVRSVEPAHVKEIAAMRRREFLTGAAAVTAGVVTPRLLGAPAAGRRPNIMMIPVDDLKPLLHCYGTPEILTPNIDRLAARGTIFLNNCCQQAVCGPTRASLMTGLYPDSTGVWDLRTRMRDVHPDVLALPQYFRQQGYETTGVGKTYDPRCVDRRKDAPSWSIPYGSEKPQYAANMPRPARGYLNPETRAAVQKARAALKGRKFRSGGARNRAMAEIAGVMTAPATECVDAPDNAYPDGALAAAGCRLLEKLAAGGKPFFLSVGFYKPHLPFVAPKKYWDLYDPKTIKVHPFQEHAKNGPELAYHNSGELRSYSDIPDKGPIPPEMQIRLIHGYRACVSYTDAQVGKLLDKLDELGLADNTIICLWGDHGWHLGDHAMWCKHSNFEQAVRAPLIFSAPGRPGGQRCASPTGFVDIFPTFCELAGLPVPVQLQGKSLVPLLERPKASIREAILSQYPRRIDGRPVMGYTLRDKRYRYVKWIQMDYRRGARSGLLVARELYDYQVDPLETVNQAENTDYAPIVARFEAIFKRMNVARHTGTYTPAAAMTVVHGVGAILYNGFGRYLQTREIEVRGQPFAKATEVTVFKVPERRSGAAYKRLIMIPVQEGQRYRLSFYCRSEKGGEFIAIFQRGRAPFKVLARERIKPGPTWRKVALIARPGESYKLRELVLTCHLGKQKQTIEFADVRVEKLD